MKKFVNTLFAPFSIVLLDLVEKVRFVLGFPRILPEILVAGGNRPRKHSKADLLAALDEEGQVSEVDP